MTTLKKHRRDGAILAIVLIALMVVLMIGGAITRAVVVHHYELRRSEQGLQAEWIAEAAMQRARRTLSRSADYRGESWEVPAGILGNRPTTVTIAVESPDASPSRRLIRVQLPATTHKASRLLRFERTVEISRPGGSS